LDQQAFPGFLGSGGEMGARIRAHDWAATPLGSIRTWPQSLKTAVDICLASPQPLSVVWGTERIQLYNDAYIAIAQDRHPGILGRPALENWPDVCRLIAPILDRVLAGGEVVMAEDLPVTLRRADGEMEKRFFTCTFSAIRDEGGAVGGVMHSIAETTAKMRAEHRLEEVAAVAGLSPDFRALFEAAPTPLLVLASDLRIVAVNDAYLRATMTERGGILGRDMFDVFPDNPADPEATGTRNLRASLERVLATHRPDTMAVQKYDVRRTAAAGGGFEERWWSPVNTPVLGTDGQLAVIIHRVEDVTEIVRLRSAGEVHDQLARDQLALIERLRETNQEAAHAGVVLRESEERYRSLFTSLDAGFCVIELKFDETERSLDYRFVEVNPAFEAQTGLKDAAGRWMRELAPDHEQHWFDVYGRVALTGEPVRFENAAEALGRWYDVHAFRIGGPRARRVAILFNDISDRRRAEEALRELNVTLEGRVAERTGELLASERRFRAIFDSAFQFMALLAVDGTVLEVNQTAMAWSGITPGEIVHRPFWQAAPMRDNPELQSKIRDEINRAAVGQIVRSEHEMRGSGDTHAVVDFSLKPVFDEDGSVVHVIAEGRDITELKLAQELLRQSQKMEAVGQLTGGLAHDFNNLLAGISGSLELLQTRVAQGRLNDLERYLVAAQGASKRAAALTHRLLAFSRRQTLDPRPTDVNRLIVGMEELVRRTVGPEVTVEVAGAGGLWTTLVDPNQLENALLNLCVNARDAMPGGGRLTIETGNRWLDERGARERDLQPGQYVSLCVSDSGTGMTPEVIARAFDPFFTTKPIGMGTGLGLSMVYGFARQSGGQTRIYSELGQGAMVCLYLPRHHGQAESGNEPAELARAPRAGQGETVLVVDDEPTVRMLVTEVLEDLGYTAIEAADGMAGLQVLQSDVRIDLLVTDVGLPGMNGRQVADAARVSRPDLRVLFITGYAENAVLSHGHLDPGMHVMTKPFAIDALASRIKELIGQA